MPGALGMLEGRVGVVTKGKRFDATGKPTQVRLRWPDGSHSRWRLIQDVQLPPEPLSTIAQAMAAVEQDKLVAQQAEDAALHAAAMKETRQQVKTDSHATAGDAKPAQGDAAVAFFETGIEVDDNSDVDGEVSAVSSAGATDGHGQGDDLLGVRQTGGEQTTDNSVWEPDRLLA
eukprot:COSAG02_NODE_7963_length_2770_cov_11.080494_2_plen_174_part_00